MNQPWIYMCSPSQCPLLPHSPSISQTLSWPSSHSACFAAWKPHCVSDWRRDLSTCILAADRPHLVILTGPSPPLNHIPEASLLRGPSTWLSCPFTGLLKTSSFCSGPLKNWTIYFSVQVPCTCFLSSWQSYLRYSHFICYMLQLPPFQPWPHNKLKWVNSSCLV